MNSRKIDISEAEPAEREHLLTISNDERRITISDNPTERKYFNTRKNISTSAFFSHYSLAIYMLEYFNTRERVALKSVSKLFYNQINQSKVYEPFIVVSPQLKITLHNNSSYIIHKRNPKNVNEFFRFTIPEKNHPLWKKLKMKRVAGAKRNACHRRFFTPNCRNKTFFISIIVLFGLLFPLTELYPNLGWISFIFIIAIPCFISAGKKIEKIIDQRIQTREEYKVDQLIDYYKNNFQKSALLINSPQNRPPTRRHSL